MCLISLQTLSASLDRWRLEVLHTCFIFNDGQKSTLLYDDTVALHSEKALGGVSMLFSGCSVGKSELTMDFSVKVVTCAVDWTGGLRVGCTVWWGWAPASLWLGWPSVPLYVHVGLHWTHFLFWILRQCNGHSWADCKVWLLTSGSARKLIIIFCCRDYAPNIARHHKIIKLAGFSRTVRKQSQGKLNPATTKMTCDLGEVRGRWFSDLFPFLPRVIFRFHTGRIRHPSLTF